MNWQPPRIGNYNLLESAMEDKDPRGIIWIWEPPRARSNYVVAVDPTVGLTGWDRALRTRDDKKPDNAAIQVIRCGKPDIQVAEYAAPIDPEDLAPVVNFLGRMYGEHHEEGQAQVIVEVYPGPGWITQRDLISKFGYTNLFVWRYEDSFLPKKSSKLGWYSNRSTRRDLWLRGMRHIQQRGVTINSPWLIEEMVDCTPDNFLAATARAGYGKKDDRVVSMLMAIWAANEWSMSIEPSEAAEPENPNQPDYQKCAISVESMMEDWDTRFERMVGNE